MRRSGWLVVLVVAGLVAACSGGDGSVFDTSGGSSTTSLPGESTTTLPGETTTTSVAEGFGVVEGVFPEEGSLIVSAELGIVPVNLLLVAMEVGRPVADAEAVAASVGGQVVGRLEVVGFYQISFPGASEADLLAVLGVAAAQPGVVLALEDGAEFLQGDTCESQGVLGESSYGEGTNARPLEMIGVEEAWAIIRASGVEMHGATVGVIDSKMGSGSPEAGEGSIIEGMTPADVTADPGLTHGLKVAQVLGAPAGNGGIVGVAAVPGSGVQVRVSGGAVGGPDVEVGEADRELLEVYQQDGKAFTSSTMAAMLTQIRNGATVVNLSFGPHEPGPHNARRNEYYRLFLERMYARYPGVVFVAAAGNQFHAGDAMELNGQNYGPGGIPAPNLITVGGLNNQGDRVGFSHYEVEGGEVTLAAPAENIPVGVGQDGKTVTGSGTSYATPMVSGAAALMKSINPELTAEEIKQILVETAYKGAPAAAGSDTSALVPQSVGGRILRVDEAVLRVINDLLVDSGEDPLDKDTLLALARLQGEISPVGGSDYEVVATVEEVQEDGSTSLSIELLGQGSIEGDSIQSMPFTGDASWALTAADAGTLPSVRICRTDTQACCDLAAQPPTLDGHYSGTATIATISGCPPTIDGDAFIGLVYTLEMDLVTNPDGTGTASATFTATIDTPTGPQTGSFTSSATVTWEGSQIGVTFTEATVDTSTWQGIVSTTDGTVSIAGSFQPGTGANCQAGGTWELTRTG